MYRIRAGLKTMKLRRIQLEDDLKMKNVEYLRNNWLNLTQTLDFSLGDQNENKIP